MDLTDSAQRIRRLDTLESVDAQTHDLSALRRRGAGAGGEP
jgi:hypothetical protein